jgi:hypothetical protein
MFGLDASAFDAFLVFDPFLVAALFPIGKILGVQAFASFTEFVDDDVVGNAIVEHTVDHVASFFGESRYFAIAP